LSHSDAGAAKRFSSGRGEAVSDIRDEFPGGHCRVASFFPFHTTYWLNGHSFIERELKRAGIGFHENRNAFLA
jgi:hypothetical protein